MIKMSEVLYQHNIFKNDNIYHLITIGYCSECGCEVRKSQYGTDEDCPKCNKLLKW